MNTALGRPVQRNVVIIPMRKSKEWWEKAALDRQTYFYPHNELGSPVVTYFECADEHLATFDQICQSLRDVSQNPEWRFVTEGPEWRGRRVLRW